MSKCGYFTYISTDRENAAAGNFNLFSELVISACTSMLQSGAVYFSKNSLCSDSGPLGATIPKRASICSNLLRSVQVNIQQTLGGMEALRAVKLET
jgi:hypothetical protein